MSRICQNVLKNAKKSSTGNMSSPTAKNTKTNLVQQPQRFIGLERVKSLLSQKMLLL